MEHQALIYSFLALRILICDLHLVAGNAMADDAEVQCQLSGRIVYDSKPSHTRFGIYIYEGREAAHDRMNYRRHFLANTDKPATFGDVFKVKRTATHLSIYYELESSDESASNPVATYGFRQPKDTSPLLPKISGLETIAYSKLADSPTLRKQAVRMAGMSGNGSNVLFDLAFETGAEPAQKVEAVRVKARTVVDAKTSPAKALEIVESGTTVVDFGQLSEPYKKGYWRERLDYFERFVFAKGFGRDRDGSFETATKKDPEVKAAWDRMNQDWEQSPPSARAPSLALVTSVADQQRVITNTLSSGSGHFFKQGIRPIDEKAPYQTRLKQLMARIQELDDSEALVLSKTMFGSEFANGRLAKEGIMDSLLRLRSKEKEAFLARLERNLPK